MFCIIIFRSISELIFRYFNKPVLSVYNFVVEKFNYFLHVALLSSSFENSLQKHLLWHPLQRTSYPAKNPRERDRCHEGPPVASDEVNETSMFDTVALSSTIFCPRSPASIIRVIGISILEPVRGQRTVNEPRHRPWGSRNPSVASVMPHRLSE